MSGSSGVPSQLELAADDQHEKPKAARAMSPAKLPDTQATPGPPTPQAHNAALAQDIADAGAPPNSGTGAPQGSPKMAIPVAPKEAAIPTGGRSQALQNHRSPGKLTKPARGSGSGNPTAEAPAVKSGASAPAAAAGRAEKPNIELKDCKDDPFVSSTHRTMGDDGSREDVYSVSTCGPSDISRSRGAFLYDAAEQASDTDPPGPLAGTVALEGKARKAEEPAPTTAVYCVFALVFLLEVFVNFDSGIVPAILPTLEEEFGLYGTTEGLLGALPYIGLGLSSPFFGRGLTLFSPKYFCLLTMFVNVLATGLFGLALSRWMLFFSRFIIGLTQAGFTIYAPVWIDRYAPADKLTLWMGLAQVGVVLGTVLGCVTAGALDAARRSGVAGAHWRYAPAIQFGWLLILVVAWGFTPRSLLEIPLSIASSDETESVASSQSLDDTLSAASVEEASWDEDVAAATKVKIYPPPSVPPADQDIQGAPMRRAKSAAPRVALKAPSQGVRGFSSSEEEGGGGRKDSAAEAGGRVAPHRERRSIRSTHRQSDLPEYLKDPLSNLLPLDFFASNAQPRRVSQTRHLSLAVGGDRRVDGPQSATTGCNMLSSPKGGGAREPEARLSARQQAMLRGRARSACDTRGSQGVLKYGLGQWNDGLPQDSRAEGINTFQYQMTFLTPHPTTLAFEALNWASGTQDPMLLVQREPRQPCPAAQRSSGRADGFPAGDAGAEGLRAGRDEINIASTASVARGYPEPAGLDLEKNSHELAKVTAVEVSRLGPTPRRTGVPKTFGVRDSIRILLSSPLYVCVTFSLCALFFEVTAIQFWSITYFQQVLKHSTGTVLVAFNVTAVTAPILGVLVGGWFVDFVGGYKDERGMRTTLSILLLWAIACVLLGIGAGWTSNFWIVVFCMWWILFFGGGILPAATGIVIASVPVEVRAFGSGFCMMVYNVFGYVLGTFMPGILIEAVSLIWGMRVIYLWSLNGVLGFACACCFLWRLEIKPTFISDVDEERWPQQASTQDGNAQVGQRDIRKKQQLASA